MQHEPLGGAAVVERIAQDWMAQSVAGVNTELMRAPGDGPKLDACAIGLAGQNPKVGRCGAALNVIDDLIRPIVNIETHGKVDRALIIAHKPADKRNVAFLGLAFFELERELALRIGIERDDHQARGVHIEPVNDQLPERERRCIGLWLIERRV